MVKTAIAFMLGCVLFLQLRNMPNSLWFWALLPACILLIHANTRLFAYFLFGMLWTMLCTAKYIESRLSPDIEGQDIIITGIVATIPIRDANYIRFIFKPDKSSTIILPDKLRINWYKPLPIEINSGEHWQLTLRLKQIHGMSNPGGYDYESWLFQQGIGATGYVRAAKSNYKLTSAPNYAINTLRQSLLSKLNTHLKTSPNLGLIEGLTTGIRHNISQQQWQTLRASGTSHLLAISGLHIGLAAAIGFFCFRYLWSLRAKNLLLLPAIEFASLGAVSLALFYAALAGFSIPTQRALIMAIVVLLGILSRKPSISSSLLAISLLTILVIDPFSVLSAGFWLSFSAVALILFVSQNRHPIPRCQWLKIHGLLAFGLSPFLLFFFLQTSLIAPVANIIAIPFISLIIVPLLLLASILLWLFEPLGIVLLHFSDYLLSLFWPLLNYLASVPYASYSVQAIPLYYILSLVIGTLLLLSPRGFPAKWLGIIGFAPLLLFSPPHPNKNEFWFTLLDVGQGLSAVIQTYSHTLVFDTGPKFSDSFNTGTAVIKPFLQSSGINKIDTLVISHGDNDHIGGALPLINKVSVSTILTSVTDKIPNSRPCYSGQDWYWDGVYFEFLSPNQHDVDSKNNLSCVLKVSNNQGSVLLTGDIEKSAESRLIKRYPDSLNATILVAPHHGSKTSSSLPFINAVKPKLVFIPAGYRNRYHFPHINVLKRFQQQEIPVFNTAEHGAISIQFYENELSPISSWRYKTRKIWTNSN
ncbi:DNA internalization-related competence protein ComEC/Rec2 [Pseudomonadota bacterium]|nr:DNA internalization-related competence protein ComEC/Rec2 [Pseudomonadota bacterium]